MIRNEREYQEAVRRLSEEAARLELHKHKLKDEGLGPEELTRVLDPLMSFHLQLREEVEGYERLRQGDLGQLSNLHGLGRMIVGLRIARGITQKDLAKRLGVHPSTVSRDERNEYFGITVERAGRLLDALEVNLTSEFKERLLPFSSLPHKDTTAS